MQRKEAGWLLQTGQAVVSWKGCEHHSTLTEAGKWGLGEEHWDGHGSGEEVAQSLWREEEENESIYGHLLGIRHCVRCLSNIISFNLPNNPAL